MQGRERIQYANSTEPKIKREKKKKKKGKEGRGEEGGGGRRGAEKPHTLEQIRAHALRRKFAHATVPESTHMLDWK